MSDPATADVEFHYKEDGSFEAYFLGHFLGRTEFVTSNQKYFAFLPDVKHLYTFQLMQIAGELSKANSKLLKGRTHHADSNAV